MKRNLLAAIMIMGFIMGASAQNDAKTTDQKGKKTEIFFSAGVSTQVHSYPNIMNYEHAQVSTENGNRNYLSEDEYGKTGEGFLPVIGFGINYNYSINSWLFFKPQLSYLQKGCSYRTRAIIEETGNSITIITGKDGDKYQYDNRFHYISGDLLLVLKLNQWKTKPYIQTGLRNEFLLFNTIEYDIDEFSGNDIPFDLYPSAYPANSHYIDFRKFNIGMVNGIGLELKQRFHFELNTNFDFGYVVKNSDLKVRNLISTFTFGMDF